MNWRSVLVPRWLAEPVTRRVALSTPNLVAPSGRARTRDCSWLATRFDATGWRG